MSAFDVTVVGGGLVGAAIAYGLSGKGLKTAILDEGDVAHRASRGNFGLVWVQGKGHGRPEYTAWTLTSAGLWHDFASQLKDETGIDVEHANDGGVVLNLSAAEEAAHRLVLEDIKSSLGNQPYAFEFMDREALLDWLPGLGPSVVSGCYSPHDGHANPLKLLRALHQAFQARGGQYRPNNPVTGMTAINGGVRLTTPDGDVESAKVVIASGLGTERLAAMAGLYAPVGPNQGQLLITERVQAQLKLPTNLVRQTNEGGLMLGASHADVGYDTMTRPALLKNIAWRCRQAFPFIGGLKVVRSWAALRIMTPDGFPIYDRAPEMPGVHVATCHSGVTLAAAHALRLPDWIAGAPLAQDMGCFETGRFNVQAVS